MDSRQVLARFEAERQALALMDHPNIARVLDAGTTEAGRPYFVMELVKGVPITKYCDEHHLTPRERLELFVPVCQAIQHAHQKGIIHRDIKPSNVLVALYDGKPVPKVIDFGVAKATGQRLTERTLFTQFGTVVGTLEYMSPEQAELNSLDIDTRSDIYSLGVLLYELLTGHDAAGATSGSEEAAYWRDAADHPRGGAAQAEHAAEQLGRGAGVDLGPAAHGAGQADEAGARRAGLDRDEGAWRRTATAATRRPTASPRTCSATWPTSRCRRARRRRGIASASSRGGTRGRWRWPGWSSSSSPCWAAGAVGSSATEQARQAALEQEANLALAEADAHSRAKARMPTPCRQPNGRRDCWPRAAASNFSGRCELQADLEMIARLADIRLQSACR